MSRQQKNFWKSKWMVAKIVFYQKVSQKKKAQNAHIFPRQSFHKKDKKNKIIKKDS